MGKADDVVIPALLRAARGSYGNAIRAELAARGLTDMPGNGSFVLGGVVNHGARVQDMVRQLGAQKPSTLSLLDALVGRGYLARDSEDASRLVVTERGRTAAEAVQAGVRRVDAELAREITPEQLAGLRAGLFALVAIRERGEDAGRATGTVGP